MGIDLNSAKVISAATGARDIFPTAMGDASKLARTLVVKAIKAAAPDAVKVRRVRDTIGGEDFLAVVDGMTAAEIKGVLGKLDKNNKEIKTADAGTQRKRFVEIAEGGDPMPVPVKEPKAPKAPKVPKPKVERGFSSKAVSAKREE